MADIKNINEKNEPFRMDNAENNDIEERLLNNNKKNYCKYIIIIISSILIISLIIFLIFFIFVKKGKNEEEEQTDKLLNFDSDYYLVNGEYKPYSFMATHKLDNISYLIRLIDESYLSYIEGVYMNNTNISIQSYYSFPSAGYYTFYVFINISSLDSIEKMFSSTDKMISIYFSPAFNTRNITNMNFLFYHCYNLTSINLSNFITSNVK